MNYRLEGDRLYHGDIELVLVESQEIMDCTGCVFYEQQKKGEVNCPRDKKEGLLRCMAYFDEDKEYIWGVK